jgi:hypothetical protein
MSYKYGVPKQTLELKGEVEHTLSSADRLQAQQTIQKLLSGAKVIDVEEAKDVKEALPDGRRAKDVVN